MKILKLSVLFIIISSFFSCVTTSDDVSLFINQDKNVKYFFPNRVWLSDSSVDFEADWLYRDYIIDDEESPRTILNFSLSSNKIIFREIPENFVISSPGYEVRIPKEQIKMIFLDKSISRYTAWLTSEQMVNLMENSDDAISISFKLKTNYLFNSPKSFKSHIVYFREVLLGLDQ